MNGEWRNDAADRLHQALHMRGPTYSLERHRDCNVLTKAALDAVSPDLANLAEAPHWEYFAALAFAYVDAPDGTDDVEAAWHELALAVAHWRAKGGREPRDPDLLVAGIDYLGDPRSWQEIAEGLAGQRDAARQDVLADRDDVEKDRNALQAQVERDDATIGALGVELQKVRVELAEALAERDDFRARWRAVLKS